MLAAMDTLRARRNVRKPEAGQEVRRQRKLHAQVRREREPARRRLLRACVVQGARCRFSKRER
jgi:hypothetical protein